MPHQAMEGMSLRRDKIHGRESRDRKVSTQFRVAVGVYQNANEILSQLTNLLIAESRVGHAVTKCAPLGGKEKQAGQATLRGELATRFHVVHEIELSVLHDQLRVDPGQYLRLRT